MNTLAQTLRVHCRPWRCFPVALIVLMAVSRYGAADCSFDDFPVMDSMKLATVAGDMQWNNKPMMIKTFTTDASLGDVVRFYHGQWRDQYADSAHAIWTQVAHLNDDCMMMVQVAANEPSGSYGRLVINNPPRVSPDTELGEGMPLPPDSVVVSDMKSVDGKKKGRLLVVTSSQSPRQVMQFYQGEMRMDGWVVEQRTSEGGGEVLQLRKGPDRLQVLAIPAGEYSQVVINHVEI